MIVYVSSSFLRQQSDCLGTSSGASVHRISTQIFLQAVAMASAHDLKIGGKTRKRKIDASDIDTKARKKLTAGKEVSEVKTRRGRPKMQAIGFREVEKTQQARTPTPTPTPTPTATSEGFQGNTHPGSLLGLGDQGTFHEDMMYLHENEADLRQLSDLFRSEGIVPFTGVQEYQMQQPQEQVHEEGPTVSAYWQSTEALMPLQNQSQLQLQPYYTDPPQLQAMQVPSPYDCVTIACGYCPRLILVQRSVVIDRLLLCDFCAVWESPWQEPQQLCTLPPSMTTSTINHFTFDNGSQSLEVTPDTSMYTLTPQNSWGVSPMNQQAGLHSEGSTVFGAEWWDQMNFHQLQPPEKAVRPDGSFLQDLNLDLGSCSANIVPAAEERGANNDMDYRSLSLEYQDDAENEIDYGNGVLSLAS